MGSSVGKKRPRAWFMVALLLGLSAAGCGGGQGKADQLATQAGTAPGGSSASESSVASDQGSGPGPGEAPRQEAGSGSESGTASGKSSGSGSTGAPGAPGAPTDPGEDQAAPGAPINIPAFTRRQGEPLEKLRAEIQGTIVSACGGTNCLEITVEERDGNFHPSCFVETDPRTDSEINVERGTKFVIVAGSDPNNRPCEGEPSADPSDPSPDDTSSSSDEAQSPSSS